MGCPPIKSERVFGWHVCLVCGAGVGVIGKWGQGGSRVWGVALLFLGVGCRPRWGWGITEEMVIRGVKNEIIKMVKLISPLIYFFHKKSLYLIPCSENEKDYVLLTSGAGTHWSRCECVRPAREEFEKILRSVPDLCQSTIG